MGEIAECRSQMRPLQGSKDLDNSIAHRISGQVGDGMQAEFAHQVGAMRFSCFDAEIESNCDFLAGLTFGQQLNDFALASG